MNNKRDGKVSLSIGWTLVAVSALLIVLAITLFRQYNEVTDKMDPEYNLVFVSIVGLIIGFIFVIVGAIFRHNYKKVFNNNYQNNEYNYNNVKSTHNNQEVLYDHSNDDYNENEMDAYRNNERKDFIGGAINMASEKLTGKKIYHSTKDKLEELNEMREEGIIDDVEYARLRNRLLK